MAAPLFIKVVVAGPEHFRYAGAISRAIRHEVERGTIGMALRAPSLLRAKMEEQNAILALAAPKENASDKASAKRQRWAGFCYVSPWEGGRFISTSALIVNPPFRGRGLARLLKEQAFRLCRERYPAARPFGLSTSPAVLKINHDLGFEVARYSDLPRDPDFWKGCESCPQHGNLVANRGLTCHCTAMLYILGTGPAFPKEE